MNKEIQGKWRMIDIAKDDPRLESAIEIWSFDEQKIFRIEKSTVNSLTDTIDEGDFAVNATLTAPYISFEGFKRLDDFNGKWQIIALDSEIMIMVKAAEDGGGLLQKEFARL
jgi:hypothetical protein